MYILYKITHAASFNNLQTIKKALIYRLHMMMQSTCTLSVNFATFLIILFTVSLIRPIRKYVYMEYNFINKLSSWRLHYRNCVMIICISPYALKVSVNVDTFPIL